MAVTGVSIKDKHGNKVTSSSNVYYVSQVFDSGAIFTGNEHLGGNAVATTGDYYNYELSDVKDSVFDDGGEANQLVAVDQSVVGMQVGPRNVTLTVNYFGYHSLMNKLAVSFNSNIYWRIAWYEVMFNTTSGAKEYVKRVFPLCVVVPQYSDARDGTSTEKVNQIVFRALALSSTSDAIGGNMYLQTPGVASIDAVGSEDYAVS